MLTPVNPQWLHLYAGFASASLSLLFDYRQLGWEPPRRIDSGWYCVRAGQSVEIVTTEERVYCVPRDSNSVLFFDSFWPESQRWFRGNSFVYNIDSRERQDLPRLYIHPGLPVWSPDRKKLGFVEAIERDSGEHDLELSYYDMDAREKVHVGSLGNARGASAIGLADFQWTADGEGFRLAWAHHIHGLLWHVGTIRPGHSTPTIEHDLTVPEHTWPARLSPDGTRLAYATLATADSLWICDLATGTKQPIGEAGHGCDPLWSPLGTRMAYIGFAHESECVCVADASNCQTMIAIPVNQADDVGQAPPIRPSWVTDDLLVYGSMEEPSKWVDRVYCVDVPTGQSTLLAEVVGVLSQLVGLPADR